MPASSSACRNPPCRGRSARWSRSSRCRCSTAMPAALFSPSTAICCFAPRITCSCRGTPRTLDDLDEHRIILLSDPQVQPHLQNRSWLIDAGRNGSGPREPYFRVNNILGLVRACQQGLGIAALPDYLVEENNRLVQLFGESDSIQLDTYFVYPEELKTVARVQVFRDFVVSKAQRWPS